jgi:DNA replicative helicase MCM subunit Mcm2 (Cdc46/Mcm family)
LRLYIERILDENIDKLSEPYDKSKSSGNNSKTDDYNKEEEKEQSKEKQEVNSNINDDSDENEPYLELESVNNLKIQREGKFCIKGVVTLIADPKKGIKQISSRCLNCNTLNTIDIEPYALRSPINKKINKCINCGEKDFDEIRISQDINYRIFTVQDNLSSADIRKEPWKLLSIIDKDEYVSSLKFNDKIKVYGRLTIPICDAQKPIVTSKSSMFEPVFMIDKLEKLGDKKSNGCLRTEQDTKNIKRFLSIPDFEVDCQKCFQRKLNAIREASNSRYYYGYIDDDGLEGLGRYNDNNTEFEGEGERRRTIDDKSICKVTEDEDLDTIGKLQDWREIICTHRETRSLADRLTLLFAPHIIGHNDVKLAMVLAAIGELHVLLLGPPGTAKSEAMIESTKLVENSRWVDATNASIKTLIGIVDVEGDVKMLIPGAIPLSHNAICGIDEIGSMDYAAMGNLHSTMQQHIISINKQGMSVEIPANTTIIATANPRRINEIVVSSSSASNNNDKKDITEALESKSLKGRYPVTMALLDRFHIVLHVLEEYDTREESKEYSRLRRKARELYRARPYNYDILLSKLIEYVKQKVAKVALESETEIEFDEFYAELKGNSDIAKSTRLNEVLDKFTIAWARMHGQSTVSPEMFKQVKTCLKKIVENYVNVAEQIADPYENLKGLIVNKLRQNPDTDKKIDDITAEICLENNHIANALADRKRYRNNKRLQRIITEIEEEHKESIFAIRDKPKTLRFRKSLLSDSDNSEKENNKN